MLLMLHIKTSLALEPRLMQAFKRAPAGFCDVISCLVKGSNISISTLDDGADDARAAGARADCHQGCQESQLNRF